ncbi:hypothetical protein ACP70R_038235 [Stipagrostis hirtigluma subsp. patula]
MRREGRQHGWVYAVDRSLVDPEGKRRAVQAAAAGLTSGLVRAPRKPTNHSKFTGGGTYRYLIGKDGSGGASAKGRQKFKHDEIKMYYLEEADDAAAGDALVDWYD